MHNSFYIQSLSSALQYKGCCLKVNAARAVLLLLDLLLVVDANSPAKVTQVKLGFSILSNSSGSMDHRSNVLSIHHHLVYGCPD